jgi:predicted Zn-dependent protease
MYGQFLYQAGKVEESIRQFQSTLQMEPHFWVAHICLAKSCEQLGKYKEALAACEHAWQYSGGNTEALSLSGYVHAIAGAEPEARAKLQQLQDEASKRYVPPYNLALVFAGLKQTDQALHWLERACADRDVHMTFLLDHKWNVLRSEPGFISLLERCGFAGTRGQLSLGSPA